MVLWWITSFTIIKFHSLDSLYFTESCIVTLAAASRTHRSKLFHSSIARSNGLLTLILIRFHSLQNLLPCSDFPFPIFLPLFCLLIFTLFLHQREEHARDIRDTNWNFKLLFPSLFNPSTTALLYYSTSILTPLSSFSLHISLFSVWPSHSIHPPQLTLLQPSLMAEPHML